MKKQKLPVVTTSYKCMEVLLNAGSCFVRQLVVYRPPSSGKSGIPSSVFFEEFSKHLEELCTTSGQLLILGDFNFHMDQPSEADVKTFQTIMETFNLNVEHPTHRKGHILDLR